jgi:hypothetical protein
MIKNVKEAYKHTMEVVKSLERQGIEVIIKKRKEAPEDSEGKKITEEVEPNRIKWSDWRSIEFKVKDEEEASKVSFARSYLGTNGCWFDAGAGFKSINWEIDWSFEFTGEEEDLDRKDFDTMMEEFCLKGFNN